MKYDINLISKKDDTLFDRFVHFSLNYLRYILVITQVAVIGTLIYRLKIDNSIVDLKESIEQKKEILKVTTPLLNEAKKIDTQFESIRDITTEQDRTSGAVKYILSVFPQNIYLTKFNIADDTYTLSGNALDPNELKQFYLNLKKQSRFSSVDLSTINKTEEGFTFAMTLRKFNNK